MRDERLVRWQVWKGGRIVRWQGGKGGKVVSGKVGNMLIALAKS